MVRLGNELMGAIQGSMATILVGSFQVAVG
jgi:hypothetical protein